MNTAAPTFRCRFCQQVTEWSSVPPVACTCCLTPLLLGRAQPAPLEMSPLSDMQTETTATAPTEWMAKPSTDLPDGLLAELVESNGGQPVTPGLARLVWMLGDLLIDAQDELVAIAVVLKHHGYLNESDYDLGVGQPLCAAVRSAVYAAEDCQAVAGVLTHAGFYPSSQSLPDVVEEVVALATDGEEAFALLLDSGFMPDSYLVHDALRTTLAAAAASAGSLQELEESYELQSEAMQELAVTARRLLDAAHTTGGHSGEISDCNDCVSDRFRILMLSGLDI